MNGNGEPIEAWTQWDKLFIRAHKVTISPYDPDKHVWILDDYGQQIFKFTHDGKQLLMTLGEREVTGTDERHFGRPTDIAFLPDGSFFVSDGYVNTRVMKFDRDGKFLMQWGTKGTGPGQFNLVHCVAVDARGRVYVVDRSNSRIQVFDQNGVYLDEWPGIRSPTHIHITQDQYAWVSDSVNMRLMKSRPERQTSHVLRCRWKRCGRLEQPPSFQRRSGGQPLHRGLWALHGQEICSQAGRRSRTHHRPAIRCEK